MSGGKIEISILNNNDITNFEVIFNFITAVDDEFPTPVSNRVDIGEFVAKALNQAIILQAAKDDDIIGLASFYANDFANRESHLTFIAVNSRFKGMGIASNLIKMMVSILEEKEFLSVDAMTDEQNLPARSLYEKMGFRLIENKEGRVKYRRYL